MPKGKRKNKGPLLKLKGETSDEDSNFDNASIITGFSDNRSILEEEPDQPDEATQEEIFEEKLKEALDGLSEKSSQRRLQCLESISNGFLKKIVPDFINDRRLTITDAIEKCLKKGRGQEQSSAATLAILVCFQLGDIAYDMRKSLGPLLQALSRDQSVQVQARAKCCCALGLISFLAGSELNDIVEPMQSLESIFSGSYLKGNGAVPIISSEEANLHAAALSSWSLLLTLLSPGDVYTFMSSTQDNHTEYLPQIEKLEELLDSSSLEVRMAAGECICLAYELGRDYDSDFEMDNLDSLCETLKQLANDSHKYRAKKDRKTQRSSFREILHFIEDDVTPDIQVKFGQEMLLLDTWCRKKQYDTICSVLGSGMNYHLSENKLLREIFELGEKVSTMSSADLKQSKHDRHLANAAAFKARTISRGKNRDKRSVVLAC